PIPVAVPVTPERKPAAVRVPPVRGTATDRAVSTTATITITATSRPSVRVLTYTTTSPPSRLPGSRPIKAYPTPRQSTRRHSAASVSTGRLALTTWTAPGTVPGSSIAMIGEHTMPSPNPTPPCTTAPANTASPHSRSGTMSWPTASRLIGRRKRGYGGARTAAGRWHARREGGGPGWGAPRQGGPPPPRGRRPSRPPGRPRPYPDRTARPYPDGPGRPDGCRPARGTSTARTRSALALGEQVAQHVLHDAAVAVVLRLAGRVDPHD